MIIKMSLSKNYLGIITARSGSKGIPNKNISIINGKPLIQYTIEAALNSYLSENLFVSTDSAEIAEVAKNLGLKVPLLRPIELATDSSSSIDAIIHFLDKMPEYENIVLLQPTSPLRNYEHINKAIETFENSECDSLVSTKNIQFNRDYYFNHEEGYLDIKDSLTHKRRQDAKSIMIPNGAIYITSQKNLRKNYSFFTKNTKFYEMNKISSLDIDDLEDMDIVEAILKNKT